MGPSKLFHFAVYQAVRDALLDRGFSYSTWVQYPHAVAELPRPAFFPSGDVANLDLELTATFPHDLELEPHEAYAQLLDNLRRERPSRRGRLPQKPWLRIASEASTNVAAFFTPMRGGYYGLARGRLGFAYHVAEFVYLLHRRYPDAILHTDGDDFALEIDDGVVGLIGGGVIDPSGEILPIEHEFDKQRLFELREAPGASVPRGLPLWRAIGAFVDKRGLREDLDLMQAIAHCRWSAPTVDWDIHQPRPRGRPALAAMAPPARKALRVEEAAELLRQLPNIEMRLIRQRLVPSIISRDRWNTDIAPITRNKKRRRGEVVEYLQRLRQELLEQA